MKKLKYEQLLPCDSVTIFGEDQELIDFKINCYGSYLLQRNEDDGYYLAIHLWPSDNLLNSEPCL